MTPSAPHITTRVVRNHRSLRRRLPELALLADVANGPTEATRVRAARHAVRFLDRSVLAQADLEDVLVDRHLDGHPTRGREARLRPQHDTLRDASAHLHDYVDAPTEHTHVAGLLRGVSDILQAHLDDELGVLLASLRALDMTTLTACEPLLGTAAPPRPTARIHLPLPFEVAERRVAQWSLPLQTRVAGAAATTIRRLAGRSGRLQLPDDFGITVDLAVAVQTDRVGLHVGRMRTLGADDVISPVEFEVVLSPGQDRFTELEVHHVTMPRHPLPPMTVPPATVPPDTIQGELTDAAIHAVVGELASIVAGR